MSLSSMFPFVLVSYKTKQKISKQWKVITITVKIRCDIKNACFFNCVYQPALIAKEMEL